MALIKKQYFYRREGGWVRAAPRFIFSNQDRYAIAQNRGPMIGLTSTLRIRRQTFKYSVRVRWDRRVHRRDIVFESGESVEVEYGYLPAGVKHGWVVALLVSSHKKDTHTTGLSFLSCLPQTNSLKGKLVQLEHMDDGAGALCGGPVCDSLTLFLRNEHGA